MLANISKVLKSDKNLASFRVLDTYENQTVPKISLVQKYDYFEAQTVFRQKILLLAQFANKTF